MNEEVLLYIQHTFFFLSTLVNIFVVSDLQHKKSIRKQVEKFHWEYEQYIYNWQINYNKETFIQFAIMK